MSKKFFLYKKHVFNRLHKPKLIFEVDGDVISAKNQNGAYLYPELIATDLTFLEADRLRIAFNEWTATWPKGEQTGPCPDWCLDLPNFRGGISYPQSINLSKLDTFPRISSERLMQSAEQGEYRVIAGDAYTEAGFQYSQAAEIANILIKFINDNGFRYI